MPNTRSTSAREVRQGAVVKGLVFDGTVHEEEEEED
jgi:hypothetical protein